MFGLLLLCRLGDGFGRSDVLFALGFVRYDAVKILRVYQLPHRGWLKGSSLWLGSVSTSFASGTVTEENVKLFLLMAKNMKRRCNSSHGTPNIGSQHSSPLYGRSVSHPPLSPSPCSCVKWSDGVSPRLTGSCMPVTAYLAVS